MRSTTSPPPARRPLSGSSRRAMGTVAESILSAVRDGTSPPSAAGTDNNNNNNNNNNPRSAKSVSLVFQPRRPPSAGQLIKRQSAAFYVSLLTDEVDGGSNVSPPPTPTSSPRLGSYFDTTVKPFLLLKGSSACDRRLVLVTWAQTLADRSFVCVRDGQRPSSATQRSRNGGPAGNNAKGRLLSTKERTTFLHFVTRESVVNDVLCAPVMVVSEVANAGVPGTAATSVSASSGVPVPFSVTQPPPASLPREQLTYSELLLVLRVALFCAASVSQSISDFDFRSRYRDRQFTLSQGSDLDSTDEDKDDGAPRPLDTVLLSCAELLLANFSRLGLVDAAGEPRESIDEAALDELLRLIHRLLLNPQAERCYGILLGLVFYALRVVDRNVRVLSDALGPIARYIDEQRLFYSMKADGEHMNRELVKLYDRMDGSFYTVVRRLRVQEALRVERAASVSAGGVVNGSGAGDDVNDGHELSGLDLLWLPLNGRSTVSVSTEATGSASNRGSSGGGTVLTTSSQYWLLLQCLERFIAFQAVERDYPPAWIELFHEEMTRREVLLQAQRDEMFLFLLHVKRHCPLHGVKEVLSGPAWFQMKAREEALREEIVREECRKHEFFLRIVDAYAKLPLETDPKQVANRIVPTSRPASVASEYDQERVKAIGFASMMPPTAGGRTPSRQGAADGLPVAGPGILPTPPRPPLARGVLSSNASARGLSPFSGSMGASLGSSRPASAKEAFHQANRKSSGWRAAISLDENAERLGIVQEEADRHFALALSLRLALTPSQHHHHQHQQHEAFGPSMVDLSPGRRRVLEEAIASSAASADLVAKGLALHAEARVLQDWEIRERREVRTEESLMREVGLQSAFQTLIVDGLAEQAVRRQAAEHLAEAIGELLVEETSARDGCCQEEVAVRAAITALALREHAQFAGALALQRTFVLETKARASLVGGESAARDIVASLYHLETNLARRVFAVSTRGSRGDDAAAVRREEEARERYAQEWLAAFMESVADIQALQRYGRAQVAEAEACARSQLTVYGQLSAEVRLPEQLSRGAIESLAVARLQQAARDFLSKGVELLDVDIAAVERDLEAQPHPPDSTSAAVNHNGCDETENAMTNDVDGGSSATHSLADESDKIRRAASAQLVWAADRAERCLRLQELRTLRGAFRYYLFQLRKSAGHPVSEQLTDGAAENFGEEFDSIHRHAVGRLATSPANGPSSVVHVAEARRREERNHVGVAATVCRTRTYLRPLSAAAAAAASASSSQRRLGSASRGGPRAICTDAPLQDDAEGTSEQQAVTSSQLTEKLILFNRVWVSEETRAKSTKSRTDGLVE